MALLRIRFSPGFLALAAAVSLGAASSSTAAAPPPSPGGVVAQQSVYAAFIVNVTRFIQWPDTAFHSANEPIVIGTFARATINDKLDRAVQGETVGTHPLRTIRIQSLDDLNGCHVVYLESSEPQLNAVLSRIAHKPVLSIGEGEGFLELGGHIRFVPMPPRTQLRIGVRSLRGSGLQARSQLLRLAQAEER